MAPDVTIYTRPGCHLCDEAIEQVRACGIEPVLTNIDEPGRDTLRGRYTDCVPVVVVDGRVRFRGRVNPVLLRRLLHPPPTRSC